MPSPADRLVGVLIVVLARIFAGLARTRTALALRTRGAQYQADISDGYTKDPDQSCRVVVQFTE